MTSDDATPAERILRDLGVTSPEDIDVEAIAQSRGVFVEYVDLGGCAARLAGVGAEARIAVDRTARRSRQRFSVAHELGHWHFDRGKISLVTCQRVDIGAAPIGNAREQRANQFAADLILPRYLFSPRCKPLEVTMASVESLATAFNAGRTATALRLVGLTEKPSFIVRYDRTGRRGYFRRAPSVPDAIWPAERAHESTGAFELLFDDNKRAASFTTRPRTLKASCCVDGRDAERFNVVESSFFVRGDAWSIVWFREDAYVREQRDRQRF